LKLGRYRNHGIEAFRFLIVGGANFVLTFIVFYSLLKVIRIDYLVALFASWAVGMVFSYVLNFTWVFRPEEKLQFKARLGKYFAANFVAILLNMLTLRIIVDATGYDPFWVQCALIPLIVVFNYSTAKFWSLRAER
ncbi:MAG: GtrA family protein, partial [Rhodanobacter sp.]